MFTLKTIFPVSHITYKVPDITALLRTEHSEALDLVERFFFSLAGI